MSKDKLQKQRFELKYLISEQKAQSMRHYVSNFLHLDEYGASQPHLSYPVHSLYLDSTGFKTYQDTINGNRNRYKLRVRYYENNEDAVFLEMKRRYNNVIEKKRAVVTKQSLGDLIYNPHPSMDYLIHKNDEQLAALECICRLISQLNAKPKVHVSYLREAYESDESNAVRVTFDRKVETEYVDDIVLSPELKNPVLVFQNTVILELKFTNRYPHWMNEMVQFFGLRRESAAKYVDGINQMKHKQNLA